MKRHIYLVGNIILSLIKLPAFNSNYTDAFKFNFTCLENSTEHNAGRILFAASHLCLDFTNNELCINNCTEKHTKTYPIPLNV